jgi:DDE domain
VTLPHVHDGLSVLRMAVLCLCSRSSMYRHVHRQCMRNALHNLTTIVPATTCHQRNYLETYSRFTDKLKSYRVAKREILPGLEHRQQQYWNNRAENSHKPTRQRERRRQRLKSSGHTQRFLSTYGPIAQHFRPRRHRWSAPAYRQEMHKRGQVGRRLRVQRQLLKGKVSPHLIHSHPSVASRRDQEQ